MIVNRKDPKFRSLLAIVESVTRPYRKHNIIVLHYDSVELHDTYWDGGSRSSYSLVSCPGKMAPCCLRRLPHYAPPQFGGPREPIKVSIDPGCAVVTTGIFCGKTATATVTLSAVDFEALE